MFLSHSFHIPVYIFLGFTEQPPYHLLLIHWADALRNVKPLPSSVYCQPLMQPRDNRNPTLDQLSVPLFLPTCRMLFCCHFYNFHWLLIKLPTGSFTRPGDFVTASFSFETLAMTFRKYFINFTQLSSFEV